MRAMFFIRGWGAACGLSMAAIFTRSRRRSPVSRRSTKVMHGAVSVWHAPMRAARHCQIWKRRCHLRAASVSALAQGAAFAAKARQLAGNEAAHTEEACAVLAGINAEQAATLCDRALAQVNRNSSSPYQQWRELVQNYFSSSRNPLRGNSHDYELVQSLVSTKPD